jgi:hypothetical protein
MAHLIGMYAVGRVNHAGAVVGLHLLEDGVLRIVVNAAAGVVVEELLNHLGARAALRALGHARAVVGGQGIEGVGVRVLMSGGSLARDGRRICRKMCRQMCGGASMHGHDGATRKMCLDTHYCSLHPGDVGAGEQKRLGGPGGWSEYTEWKGTR